MMSGERVGILGCWLVSAMTLSASGAEIALVPVRASGDFTIVGNQIILESAGQQVFLEIYLSDWDPDQDGTPLLKSWQANIDWSGYTGGLEGTLTPWAPACTNDADCEALMGSLGVGAGKGGCGVPGFPDGLCAPGFINDTRSDYVFASDPNMSVVDLRRLRYRFAAAVTSSPITDPGTQPYGGTLVLSVPPDARGTFSVGFIGGDPGTSQMVDENSPPELITPLHLTPAQITVACQTAADCNDNNACTRDICRPSGTCATIWNYDPTLYCCYPVDGTLCDKPTGLPGDFDGDGNVDLADYARFQVCFGSAPLGETCAGVDMDCDCALGDSDVTKFVSALTGHSY